MFQAGEKPVTRMNRLNDARMIQVMYILLLHERVELVRKDSGCFV